MDKIRVYDEAGQEVEKEVILMFEQENKTYVMYKDIEKTKEETKKRIYASYFYSDGLDNSVVNLNNDLSEEEYEMLENIYMKGREVYDTEKQSL